MEEKICLEYVWIDGYNELRSKIKIVQRCSISLRLSLRSLSSFESEELKNIIPSWNFDGSSTGQAIGKESDVILKAVRAYKNPFFETCPSSFNNQSSLASSFLILCECFEKDDVTPHKSNTRNACEKAYEQYKEHKCLFGIEQEYVLFERGRDQWAKDTMRMEDVPYKWVEHDEPGRGGQGPYYCSVGGDRSFGRSISDQHLLYCLKAGIEICGTNAEVMASQWEFQVGTCDALKVTDDLIMARYILHKITEQYNCCASFHPKPYSGDWNGSGAHTNFSTKNMREEGGMSYIVAACDKLKDAHAEHIDVYGSYNEMRLTGIHETSSMNHFTWGVGNRGCSVRIPLHVSQNNCGYLEDRRPASNCDPYTVVTKIMNTVCGQV